MEIAIVVLLVTMILMNIAGGVALAALWIRSIKTRMDAERSFMQIENSVEHEKNCRISAIEVISKKVDGVLMSNTKSAMMPDEEMARKLQDQRKRLGYAAILADALDGRQASFPKVLSNPIKTIDGSNGKVVRNEQAG